MAAYPAYAPQWVAEGGITGPRTQQYFPAQTAAWRDGDIVTPTLTGLVTAPTGGVGTLATAAPPSLGLSPTPFNLISSSSSITQGVLTVTAQAASSAPAQTYFCVVTYDITIASETAPSQAFVINCVAGITPILTVSATGEPALATHYGVYLSYLPNTFWLQHAVTATGSATDIAYPLTNSYGLNKATAGISTGIAGVANCDSDAYYAGILGATAGGSQFTGKRSLFGATQSFGPGWPSDAFKLPVNKLQIGQLEMSLVQSYNPGLDGQPCGVNIDATTGYFVADNTQTACATLETLNYYPGYAGNVGDTGARVLLKFYGASLV